MKINVYIIIIFVINYCFMASVSEHLLLLQQLTQTNLEILQALNDSFFTKQEHLYVDVNDSKYIIPSFIALENKINMLEENFQNLVNSPSTGEAYFNIDGNSRAIEVRSYTNTPNSLKLHDVSEFSTDNTNINILKNLLTNAPKIKLNISDIPNDITCVNVKKILIKSDALKSEIQPKLVKKNDKGIEEEIPSISYKYSDMVYLLDAYKKGTDYDEYDIVQTLPIRKNIGSATYIVDNIISDIIDNDLDNYITIKIKTNLSGSEYDSYSKSLTYKLFDGVIEKKLSIGDYLTTYDGTAKLQITDIKTSSNTLTLKVINGEYTNLIGIDSYDYSKGINNYSKLKFFSPIDFDDDKYVDVTLDDTQYVFIAIAPINNRMNIQSSWGEGLLLNSHKLTMNGQNFIDYYNANVKNIGKIIEGLV